MVISVLQKVLEDKTFKRKIVLSEFLKKIFSIYVVVNCDQFDLLVL